VISEEAVEAALEVFWANEDETYLIAMERALEAAAPILLSHERQLTADAHRDAIVNRDTADRLERELETAKAEAWDEAAASIIDEHGNPVQPTNIANPYRSQA
jgi:hypothetical protein